jgi:predicted nucleic-acid-binding protein
VIAFDSNHLIRHIVDDDPKQCEIVSNILKEQTIGEKSIRIFDLVLMETSWVLSSVYEFDREAIACVFEELLEDSIFNFDDPNRLRSVIARFRTGKADFSDYLIHSLAESQGLSLKTFDKKLLSEIRMA